MYVCTYVCVVSGLVALRSEEVLEVMMEDYPSKYLEFQQVVQERHFQDTLHTKIMEARRVAVMVCVCVCLHVCSWGYVCACACGVMCVCLRLWGYVCVCVCSWDTC